MDKQGSAPYKSVEMAWMVCEQYGINLPADIVRVPEYEQLNLDNFINNKRSING